LHIKKNRIAWKHITSEVCDGCVKNELTLLEVRLTRGELRVGFFFCVCILLYLLKLYRMAEKCTVAPTGYESIPLYKNFKVCHPRCVCN